jgi:predicted TIM-barrel fold metal-dependent hydrolase
MIFDSHLHLVDRARLSYPWLAGAPALDRDWTLEAYEETARRVGITDVLHMEVDVAEADIDAETAWIATLMDRPDGLLRGVISAARPESPDFPAWLERVDRRVVRGIRRVLHVVPDEISQVPVFRENLRRLGAAGLPFDICMLARQLPLATALVDAAPDTTFVLDHCGVPDIADGDFDRWAPLVAEIARRDNLKAKISGITAYVGGPWTLRTLKPYVDHMLACFGPDRLVWGSDSPVCTLHSSLPEWVATTHALLAGLTPEEKARVLHGNAMALWMR